MRPHRLVPRIQGPSSLGHHLGAYCPYARSQAEPYGAVAFTHAIMPSWRR